MLIRISLIIAIVAGLGIAGLNFAKVQKQIVSIIADRDNEKSIKEKTQKELASTKKTLDKTTKELADTKDQLDKTTKEKDDALAQVEDLTKKNTTLSDTLKKTQQERDTARDELAAWHALEIPIDKIKATLASLKQVTADRDAIATENKILNTTIKSLRAELTEYRDPNNEAGPDMPVGLRGKVLVADPKYNFVVLDIGTQQGVVPAGRFLVSRNGQLIAKLKVKSAESNRSIANVMPGWNLAEIMEGDQVIY